MFYKLKKIVVSISIGLCNGLFGSGGGVLAVKYLEKNFKDTKKAHASSLIVIVPISIVSIIIYYFKNSFDLSLVFLYIIGGLMGCYVGTKLLKKINKDWLGLVFSILIMYLSIRLWFS